MPSDLTFRLLADDERDLWDAFAAAHPRSDFAQAWDWGRMKAEGEWSVVRAGLFGADGLVAGAQILTRPLPYLGGRLAYASRGPLTDLETVDGAGQRAALFDGLEAWCRGQGAVCLKVDPCITAEHDRFLRVCGARPAPVENPDFGGTQPKYVMRLDLSAGLDRVMAGFKPDYRNRIRKSERRGVTVRRAESTDDWRVWYDLLLGTADRQHFRVRAFSYFESIRTHLQGACQAWLLVAEREGRQVGGILCLRYGQTVWYLYGAMNEEGREHYSGYLLQWDAMQRAVAEGCGMYDFRGVAPFDREDSPHFGLNRFKSGFGPAEVEWVGEWDLVFSPWRYQAFNFLLPRARALVPRLKALLRRGRG
ncbi:MAG: peptidoglycan bridge formation glycyltransferase FemA/FemB family protein [Armatimonadetes bacterium]|nr:peptidoglycan bridge formation glycyltransferase FemA/FemB family protein [Armatimonadota bacterium]